MKIAREFCLLLYITVRTRMPFVACMLLDLFGGEMVVVEKGVRARAVTCGSNRRTFFFFLKAERGEMGEITETGVGHIGIVVGCRKYVWIMT